MLQQEVADALHISVSAYAKLESGTRGISSENCIALADLFGVTCDYILRGVDSQNIDICKKTALDQETLAVLIMNKAKSIPDPLSRKKNIALLNDIDRKMEERLAIETEIICEEAEANDYVVSNVFLNRFIQDEKLWEELRRACGQYKMCLSEICREHERNNGFPTVQEMYNQMGLDASRYIAGQAFAEFFLQVFRDASFCQKISNLKDDDIDVLRRLKLLDVDTKEV